jgi:hypothetical protein
VDTSFIRRQYLNRVWKQIFCIFSFQKIRSPAPSSTHEKTTTAYFSSSPFPAGDEYYAGKKRRHLSSLLDLPQDLCIEIAAHVGATLDWPLADLLILRSTCSTMRHVCSHRDVGRRFKIEGIRDEIFLGCGTPPHTKPSLLC